MITKNKRSSLVAINSIDKLQRRCKQLDNSTSGEAFVDRLHYCSKKLFESYNDPESLLPKSMAIENKWQNIIKRDLSETDAYLQSAIWEFITTERTYITRLNILVHLFLEMFCRLKDEGDFKDIDIFDIFANIKEIHRVQEEFWTNFINPMLSRARETKNCFRARDLFMTADKKFFFKQNFKCYETFCLREQKCLQYIQNFGESKGIENNIMLNLEQWLSWCESLALSGRLKLRALLTEPRIRLCRYNILLKEIIKRLTNEREIKFIDEKRKECHAFLLSIENQMKEQVKYRELKACIQQLEDTSPLETEIDFEIHNCTSIKDFLCFPIRTTYATLPRFILDERFVKLIRGSQREKIKVVLFTDTLGLLVPSSKQIGIYQVVNHLYHLDKLNVIKSKRYDNVVVLLYLDTLGLLAETLSFELHPDHIEEWVCTLKKARCCFMKILRGEGTTFDFYNDTNDHVETLGSSHISYKYFESEHVFSETDIIVQKERNNDLQESESNDMNDGDNLKSSYQHNRRSSSLDFLDRAAGEGNEEERLEGRKKIFYHKSTQTFSSFKKYFS